MQADLLKGVPEEMLRSKFLERVAFVAAFPPCTHLVVSGARWFKGKGLRSVTPAGFARAVFLANATKN